MDVVPPIICTSTPRFLEILSEAPTAKIDFGTFLTSMADHLRAVRENRAEEEAEAIKNAFQLIEEINRGHKHDDEGGRGGERGEGGRGGGSGTISRRRLTRLLTRVGEKLNKHEIDELLDDVGESNLKTRLESTSMKTPQS